MSPAFQPLQPLQPQYVGIPGIPRGEVLGGGDQHTASQVGRIPAGRLIVQVLTYLFLSGDVFRILAGPGRTKGQKMWRNAAPQAPLQGE
eukprot:gene7309-biopygen22527